jgi:hypothetical protein
LSHLVLQNLHPSVRSHLQFSSTTLAEAVVVEKQRELVTPTSTKATAVKLTTVTWSMVVSPASGSFTGGVKRYKCGGIGNVQRNCFLVSSHRVSVPKEQVNASGAWQRERLEPRH